ncbi:MAG: zinc-dependent peptidase, partial [Betaproteobacteria bacterium]
ACPHAHQDANERFTAALDQIEATLPAPLAPDDEAAEAYDAHLPLDADAAYTLGEFFAVSSEAFFVDPTRLAQAFPPWYRQLALFFRQDPLGLGIGPDSGLAPAGGARGGAP